MNIHWERTLGSVVPSYLSLFCPSHRSRSNDLQTCPRTIVVGHFRQRSVRFVPDHLIALHVRVSAGSPSSRIVHEYRPSCPGLWPIIPRGISVPLPGTCAPSATGESFVPRFVSYGRGTRWIAHGKRLPKFAPNERLSLRRYSVSRSTTARPPLAYLRRRRIQNGN